MERTIKFRAKSIIDGAWKYGMLAWCTPHNVVIRDEHGQDWTCTPGTEGQYTGLKDKNGKEVYEDDVIEAKGWSPMCYRVRFIEGGFCMTDLREIANPIDINLMYSSVGCAFKVIGNACSNPELLTP